MGQAQLNLAKKIEDEIKIHSVDIRMLKENNLILTKKFEEEIKSQAFEIKSLKETYQTQENIIKKFDQEVKSQETELKRFQGTILDITFEQRNLKTKSRLN